MYINYAPLLLCLSQPQNCSVGRGKFMTWDYGNFNMLLQHLVRSYICPLGWFPHVQTLASPWEAWAIKFCALSVACLFVAFATAWNAYYNGPGDIKLALKFLAAEMTVSCRQPWHHHRSQSRDHLLCQSYPSFPLELDPSDGLNGHSMTVSPVHSYGAKVRNSGGLAFPFAKLPYDMTALLLVEGVYENSSGRTKLRAKSFFWSSHSPLFAWKYLPNTIFSYFPSPIGGGGKCTLFTAFLKVNFHKKITCWPKKTPSYSHSLI